MEANFSFVKVQVVEEEIPSRRSAAVITKSIIKWIFIILLILCVVAVAFLMYQSWQTGGSSGVPISPETSTTIAPTNTTERSSTNKTVAGNPVPGP